MHLKHQSTIRRIRIFQIRIPFSVQVTHNLAKRNGTRGFLVEITDNTGQKGYGEGTPRSYVTGEDFVETQQTLSLIGKEILGSEIENEGFFLHFWHDLKSRPPLSLFPSATCSFELALLDLFCKRAQIPLWNLLVEEPAIRTISYSSILPLLAPKQRQAILLLTQKYGISQIKLKASSIEETLKAVSEIKSVLGHKADIRIDANEAFKVSEVIQLTDALRDAGLSVSALEQPVRKDDLAGMKQVEKKTGIPVIADESFCSDKDLEKIIQERCCKGLNVRLSKCGGILNSKDMIDRAKKAGLFCQLGCHVGETSVLYAAGRHLAAVCGPFRFTEGCYSKFLLKEDLVEQPLEFGTGGLMDIPTRPGLGVKIKEEALKKHCHLVFEEEK